MTIKRFVFFVACLVGVAVAAAGTPVFASEWIGSESESIGSFGVEDNTPIVNLEDLMDGMEDVGLDLSLPTSTPSLPSTEVVPVFTPEPTPVLDSLEPSLDLEQDLVEDAFNNYVEDMEQEPYLSYDAYYGAISSTYLEYMRGFLPKLGFKEHYVAARVSQYTYIFAYGTSLEYTGTLFRGTNMRVVSFYTNGNGSYSVSTESSFNLYPNSCLVYSDLSMDYPSLSDTTGISSRQILILLTIMGLVWTIDHMYNVRKIRRLK